MRTLLFLISVLYSVQALAHPHSWISQQTQIIGDSKHITDINMVWHFDIQTTAYALDGMDMSPKHKKSTIEKLKSDILENLMSAHYFTYFYDGKTPIRFYPVEKADLKIQHRKMIMRFKIELAKPQPLNNHKLSLLIYDPSYYTDMFWDKPQQDVTFSPALQKHCAHKIEDPQPSDKDKQYAATIPIGDNPDFDLGQLFAQRLVFQCHS